MERQLGPLGEHAVVGRPVTFVGTRKPEDETLAPDRLRRAYAIAGFDHIRFEYEPIGAAYSYAQRLKTSELVLIADFGGGTSDFSVVQLSPGSKHDIVATAGVPVGGDTFDARIIRHLVSPILGLSHAISRSIKPFRYRHLCTGNSRAGTTCRSCDPEKTSESWRAFVRRRMNPQKIARFLEIVADDLGYHLHRSVQRAKWSFESDETEFVFADTSVEIRSRVTRREFESWIGEDLVDIERCVGNS